MIPKEANFKVSTKLGLTPRPNTISDIHEHAKSIKTHTRMTNTQLRTVTALWGKGREYNLEQIYLGGFKCTSNILFLKLGSDAQVCIKLVPIIFWMSKTLSLKKNNIIMAYSQVDIILGIQRFILG